MLAPHARKDRRGTRHACLGDRLTAKDSKVIALIYRGCSNKEIAYRMGVGQGTIKMRLFLLFQKLGVHSRCEIMARRIEELESVIGVKAA